VRKSIAVIGAIGALALSAPVATAKPHDVPGTPGEANCKGQTTAYLAQAAKNFDFVGADAHGLGGLARNYYGLSVKEVHAIIDTYCGV
jgi:hypothetical protein